MIKFVCDRCSALIEQSKIRFTLRIELFAAYDGLDIRSLKDLQNRDIQAEIQQLLKKMETMDPKQLERDIYSRHEFDLCKNCRDQLLQQLEERNLP